MTGKLAPRWLPLCFLVAGLLMAYHRQIFSGLELMQPDPYDVQHLNYVLEHAHRWALGADHHSALWSPPVFYPETNTAAYSESLLGLLPFYAPWRLLGFAPDTAVQLLGFLLGALNFGASFLFIRRCTGVGRVASCMGAFLFSFSSSRVMKLGHLHLIGQFFTLGALLALVRIFEDSGAEPTNVRQRSRWVWAFAACVVAQLYAGFYLAWFLGFGLMAAGAWALILPATRWTFLDSVKELWRPCAAAAVAAAIAVLPLAVHHLEAARLLGMRDFQAVQNMLPRAQTWLNHGPHSWLYGWVTKLGPVHRMPFEWEHRMGIGIATGSLVLYGLWRGRRRRFVRILTLATATILLLATRWPGGFTLWRWVYELLPGAAALRAVSRIGLMALVLAAVGFALAWDDLRRRRPRLLVALLGLFCLLEQGQSLSAFAKQEVRRQTRAVAERLPADCDAFFYSPLYRQEIHRPQRYFESIGAQLTAMWAGLYTGIPTLNGYSSNLPPGWQLLDLAIDHSGAEASARQRLEQWLVAKGLKDQRICWLKVDATNPTVYTVERVARSR